MRCPIPILVLAALVPRAAAARQADDLIDRAERFVHAIYLCDSAAIDELASPDIVVTWPIFEELFDTTGFVGRDAVRTFADGFCSRWHDPELVFDAALADDGEVVLVWSFSAHPADAPADAPRQSWGGISLYRFDEDGLIETEIGEESSPGPFARLRSLR